jgi:hypothetical protein
MELAAPVAAERDHHQRRRRQPGVLRLGAGEAHDRLHQLVHEAGVGPHGVAARFPAGVPLLERGETFDQRRAKEFQTKPAAILGALCPGLGAPGPAMQLGRHDGPERTSAVRLMSIRTQIYAKGRRVDSTLTACCNRASRTNGRAVGGARG